MLQRGKTEVFCISQSCYPRARGLTAVSPQSTDNPRPQVLTDFGRCADSFVRFSPSYDSDSACSFWPYSVGLGSLWLGG